MTVGGGEGLIFNLYTFVGVVSNSSGLSPSTEIQDKNWGQEGRGTKAAHSISGSIMGPFQGEKASMCSVYVQARPQWLTCEDVEEPFLLPQTRVPSQEFTVRPWIGSIYSTRVNRRQELGDWHAAHIFAYTHEREKCSAFFSFLRSNQKLKAFTISLPWLFHNPASQNCRGGVDLTQMCTHTSFPIETKIS